MSRPKALDVRAARRDLVADVARKRPEVVATVDDLAALFPSWAPEILGRAVDDNVDAGTFTEPADGRLCVKRAGR